MKKHMSCFTAYGEICGKSGNVSRMGRKELAEYIEEKMYQEYLDFGGKDAVSAWYRQMLENRIQNLIQLCLEEYIRRDGKSKGTESMIKMACKYGREMQIVRTDRKVFRNLEVKV